MRSLARGVLIMLRAGPLGVSTDATHGLPAGTEERLPEAIGPDSASMRSTVAS
jgi:hypothetical protein